LLKVDFHTHTWHSPDSIANIRKIIAQAEKIGLDRVVITDHNRLAGALEACEIAPDLFIPGEEVQTSEGEFLAAYVTREVPRGLPPLEALSRLRDQGAFVSISHPFDPQRSGWPLSSLEMLAPLVDAIETANARMLDEKFNLHAREFAAKRGLAGTAGSDAHHPSEVGGMYSLLPDFHDAETLKIAIRSAESQGMIASPFVHGYSQWARVVKAFGAFREK
jgi:predicted metal-dependent phosphoesterase TrpH